ncbi:protein ALP1-like [Sipha flava]|uniref:Protein ALP1-like n=1 Tax=Sipha flava TaxID=143950 RepID=A0A8B8FS56_9HEMI|nr:protein ALP1-like [Sipha flava]
MEPDEVFSFSSLTYLYLKQKWTKREHWVHPINCERYTNGHYVKLYYKLREDSSKFFKYFRMSVRSFDELLLCIKNDIQLQNTNMRLAIQPEEMLVITLRYLASGCSFKELHYNYRIGRSTASEVVRKVCKSIWNRLKEICIPIPDQGAVDGKHIRIIKPERSGSLYMNYKHYFSIGLLAIADANYKFIYVDVGSYGKDSDSTIFKNSALWENLKKNNLNIPASTTVPGVDISLPYAFVGDEAFGLDKHLLRPYSGTHLPVRKKIFNYRLSRARRYVECTFGILSNKWRIFHRPIDVHVDFAVDIVKCCCVLHNFVRDRDGFKFDDTLAISGFE